MKKILIICNTYYQFIFSLNLKNTLFKEDTVYLIITDHSRNAEKVVDNTNNEKIFEKVVYLRCKALDKNQHSSREAMSYIIRTLFKKSGIIPQKLESIKFDEFLYYNLTPSTLSIFESISKFNRYLICSRYEEGVLSYNMSYWGNKSASFPKRVQKIIKLEKKIHRKNIVDSTNDFYCFYPEMYRGNLRAKEVPNINSDSMKFSDMLARIFNVNQSKLTFKEKYIYFASVGDFEGSEKAGELELAKKIADKVGKDNLLIKVHPRDNTGEFEKSGLNVYPGSDVPWEAIQLNYDFSNHVFLTCTSGSVLSVNMMPEKGPKVYFLYNLCNARNNDVISKSIPTIESLVKTEIASKKNIFIADSLDEIVS